MEVGVSQLDLGPIPGFPLGNTWQFYIQIIFYNIYSQWTTKTGVAPYLL